MPHSSLIEVLHKLKLGKVELKWFSSYLHERKQLVEIRHSPQKNLSILNKINKIRCPTGIHPGTTIATITFMLFKRYPKGCALKYNLSLSLC